MSAGGRVNFGQIGRPWKCAKQGVIPSLINIGQSLSVLISVAFYLPLSMVAKFKQVQFSHSRPTPNNSLWNCDRDHCSKAGNVSGRKTLGNLNSFGFRASLLIGTLRKSCLEVKKVITFSCWQHCCRALLMFLHKTQIHPLGVTILLSNAWSII